MALTIKRCGVLLALSVILWGCPSVPPAPKGALSTGAPLVKWRGVHLFVGPEALELHKKLWTNVLLPMGFNKVVLQCEQTEWRCLPNMRGQGNMKREDLAKLCDWYRAKNVEVIPLVESFGHAQWLCASGVNLDLVVNPKIPFTLDPRKPRVAKLMSTLWSEVISVTRAKTIHFGLDEIDFRGFPNQNGLATKLWKIQIPRLAKIARDHNVTMMLWGDELLGPGESAPPTGAATTDEAQERRSVVPTDAIVCDWHYQNDPDPNTYSRSLLLFQNCGFKTIASAWYRANNVRGQNLAAIQTGSGSLQTTWAGHELTAKVVDNNLKQFSAVILASEYARGRRDMPSQLGYDPSEVFTRMLRG